MGVSEDFAATSYLCHHIDLRAGLAVHLPCAGLVVDRDVGKESAFLLISLRDFGNVGGRNFAEGRRLAICPRRVWR
jgi:hypothetical protein